jgi:uroporphyrin-III C-methyltransferase
MAIGHVSLVGAGPGDPDLLTLKAVRILGSVDVVVFDRLVSSAVIDLVPSGTERIDVGKRAGHHSVPQPEINKLLVRLARSGRHVARLKGGDPFIFGRGYEEAIALDRAGIPYEVVPGITAAQGCAAALRVPLTHRALAAGVRYVTGHRKADEPLDLDWASLADPQTTLVVYMGLANIDDIVRQLIGHGLPGDTPALAVCQGTTPGERHLITRLIDLPEAARHENFDGPVLFIVGQVAQFAGAAQAVDKVGRMAVA